MSETAHWGIFKVGEHEVHVVPIEPIPEDDPRQGVIARGHYASVSCPACQPRLVRDGPLELDDGRVWTHNEPGWPGGEDQYQA